MRETAKHERDLSTREKAKRETESQAEEGTRDGREGGVQECALRTRES